MSKATRSYSNGAIVVEWRPELCIHCSQCTQTLPQVFNVESRPWVKMEAATSEDIAKAVSGCPSGALSLGNNSGNNS